MGYYTRFSLRVLDPTTSAEVPRDTQAMLVRDLRSRSDYANYCLDANGASEETSKWYEHEEDLKSFSKENRAFLFELSGEGEEAGDLWKKYFLGGKMQVARAVLAYPPFDPGALV